ncbi:hypothetical protein SO802_032976 [Lithocarpus litseifolius]|uniref:Uncharacterized protein n=1 Tax=Lithocarpus litseifolius TaxID=425828 RepID=A0AAW2BBV1_9ROSI
MGEESRTCNYPKSRFQKGEGCNECKVSATSCSSSMHLGQVASVMDTKADEFSDETTSKEKAVLRSYISDVELLSPSSSSGCNGGQHTSSDMSNVFSKQKELEGLGDNISCIIRSEDTKTSAGDMKNLLCTSALIDGSPAGRKAINDQFDFHYRASSHFDKVTTNHPWRPNRESSQAVVDFSRKSDQLEISSIRDFFGGASSLKGEPYDCSETQAESSLKKVTTFRVSGQLQDVNIHAGSVKDDTEMNSGNPVIEAGSGSDQKVQVGNSSVLVEGPHKWKHPSQSQLAGYNDKSITLEYEVCNFSFLV